MEAATMVGITDLPEEIFIMIIRKLDFCSLYNMYNSCKIFRNLLCLHGVVVECNLSVNYMATVNTLKLDFFKAISNNLLVLNLRGVHDLSKTKVLPALRMLKRLKTLDISYTNLNLTDFISLSKVCPTLEDATLNFIFDEHHLLLKGALEQYQSAFECLKNVHFVGSLNNLLFFNLGLNLVSKAKLNMLKFSCVGVDSHFTVIRKEYPVCQVHFNHFAIYLVNWIKSRTYKGLCNYTVLKTIDLKQYEFFLLNTETMHFITVYATPVFKKFFSQHFNIDAQCLTDYATDFSGNVALMIWNKKTTQFDDTFFSKLYRHVKPYFCFHAEFLSDVSCPESYDWVYSLPKVADQVVVIDDDNDDWRYRNKRRKSNMPNVVLDYDNLFKHKEKAKLSLIFKSKAITAVSLPIKANYFDKITFLSLCGSVNYESQFFYKIFSSFQNLVTMSVECPAIGASGYYCTVCCATRGSKTLKNLRVVDRGIELKTVFERLAVCTTLENVYIVDQRSWDQPPIANPVEFVKACQKLHSVFIEGPFSETAQAKQYQMFNKVKAVTKRPNLRVVVNKVSIYRTHKYQYDPYVEVFRISPIKPIYEFL